MSSAAVKLEDFNSELRQNSDFGRDKMISGGMNINKRWTDAISAVLLTLLVPWLLFNTALLFSEQERDLPLDATVPDEAVESDFVSVRVLTEDGTVITMDLEEYLVGVVAGEMPSDFHPEALKAQAVVARTYTLRMREGSSKHPDADICTHSECCQSYRAGESAAIRLAVESTAGQVLTYDGKLIEATYFSSSGGRTEAALAVWGSDIPYLQSVNSPETDYMEAFLETVTISDDEFRDALGIQPEGPCGGWFGEVAYTDGGGVETIEIAGRVFKGTELRKLLGLRSTAMVISAVGDHIIITTQGYGHRVGMSQYGAESMAVAGATYDEILSYYYQGTTLELFVDKDSSVG